jgi:membrane-associated phospholipid phosphatase
MTDPAHTARHRRVAWLLGGVIVPLMLFFMLAEDIGEAQMTAFDESVLRAVAQLHGDAATTVMRAVTFLGGFLGVAPLSLALAGVLVALHRRRDALFVLVVMGGAGILQYAAKLAFARPRPTVFPALVDVSTSSYPSGHAMISASLGLVLAVVCWNTRWRWPAIVAGAAFALAVSFSRLYLGVHYPSDLLAGWCLAVAWATGVWLGFDLAGRPVPSRAH